MTQAIRMRLIIGVCVVLSALTVWQVYGVRQDAQDEKARADRMESAQYAAQQQAALLEQQVKDLGARPVVNPEDLKDLKGEQGKQGVAGAPGRPPSAAEVAQAVANYCSGGRCNGRNATATQVAYAVALYCNRHGECEGPEGKSGATGKVGPAGPPGTPATDAQVFAAVQAYCDQNGCQGPPGPQGEKGDPGRGIRAVGCDKKTEKFVVYYNDGTAQVVQDSDCVALAIPGTDLPTLR